MSPASTTGYCNDARLREIVCSVQGNWWFLGHRTSGTLALTDAHGNQVGQFTAAGTSLAASQAYDPWGNVTATAGSMTGLLGYQSAWTDTAAGKNLMGARWYDPGAGDFTSADTVQVSPDPDEAAGNPFAYAADEPLDLVDPTGHYIVPEGGAEGAGTTQRIGNGATSASNYIADVTTARIVQQAVISAPDDAAKAAAARAAAAAKVNAEQATARKAAVAAAEEQARTQAAAAAEHAAEMARLKTAEMDNSRLRGNGFTSTITGADNPANFHGGNAVVGAGFAESMLNVVDGILNSPTQLMHLEDPRIPQAWNVNLEGEFASWADSRLGITPGSADAMLANASSITVQAGLALIPGADEGDAADLTDLAASCGGESFAAGTAVLLADGKTIPIVDLKPGDKVLSTNTKTGKTSAEAVTAVLVHHDTDLYNLTVKTSHGTEDIHTTSNHLFWVPSLNYGWIPANHLKPGEKLKTPDGQPAVVVGGSVPAAHDGWMWDLTVPGDNDHDFYVAAGAATVLVHNDNGGGCDEQPSLFDDTPYRVEAPDQQYARVTLRSATKQAIQDAAPRDADGNFIDPNTGQSIPQDGPFQYGHKPGFEFWRNQNLAQQQGWSREQFIEFENDPSHYQIEDPYNNMSHQYEQP